MNLEATTYQAEIFYGKNPRAIQCKCDNCDWTGTASKLKPIGNCSLTPGDPSPAGRCPKCDCIAYRLPVPSAGAVIAYAIEPEQMADLRKVMDRLYDGTRLTFDARRDLARRIHNIIDNAGELTE